MLSTINVPASSIGTTYDWVEFDFSDYDVPGLVNFWFVLSTYPLTTKPTGDMEDNTNYYLLGVSEGQRDPYGINRIYGEDSYWHFRSIAASVPFIAYGTSNDGDGREIYLAPADVTPPTRDAYDNMCLVVVDGSGKGNVMTISDYDGQAPDQWQPSVSYIAPDKWQDHVGDTEHGSWITPDAKRIFIVENPRGKFDEDSTFETVSYTHLTLPTTPYV